MLCVRNWTDPLCIFRNYVIRNDASRQRFELYAINSFFNNSETLYHVMYIVMLSLKKIELTGLLESGSRMQANY